MKWLLLVPILVCGNGKNCWSDGYRNHVWLRTFLNIISGPVVVNFVTVITATSDLVSTSVSALKWGRTSFTLHKAEQLWNTFKIHGKFSECENEKSCWRNGGDRHLCLGCKSQYVRSEMYRLSLATSGRVVLIFWPRLHLSAHPRTKILKKKKKTWALRVRRGLCLILNLVINKILVHG